MKIVHVDLGAYPYIPTWGYQENYMVSVHRNNGDDVTVIGSPYISRVYKGYINQDAINGTETTGPMGEKIIRLHYKLKLPYEINCRIRWYEGLLETLEKENPDVLFVHDLQFLSVYEISKFAKKHPECIIKADFHSTYENSAKSWISKYILHGLLYRWIVRANYKSFQKIYYVCEGNLTLLKKSYGINIRDWQFEFLPLGGLLINKKEKEEIRKRIRKKHGLMDDEIMIVHSGKFDPPKRTHELIKGFKRINNDKLHLYLIGSIPDTMKEKIEMDIYSDSRIDYLGWKTSEELREYLCAADFYIQPGSSSSTFQTAVCSGCPVALNLNSSQSGGGYTSYIDDTVVYPIWSVEEIENAIRDLSKSKELREKYSKNGLSLAKKRLDYVEQVKRITKDDRKI